MKAFLSALSVLAFAGLASANVNVSGTGKVTYVPDIGHVTVGVASEGTTAQEAWEKNREIVEKVFAALKRLGIDAKDAHTNGVSVTPKYRHLKDHPPELVGYTVGYDLRVTVRKLGDLGRVLDGLVDAGANRNVGISFGCADPEKLLDEARTKAAGDARKKAGIYAQAAGAQLGQVMSISESTSMPYRDMQFASALEAKAMPIAVGEQELSVTVSLTFGLNHPAR
jgi:uncharacterized protein